MYFPFFFDPTMILLLPALIIAFWAQAKVSSTFEKYVRQPSTIRLPAAQVAKQLLENSGVYGVNVEMIPGQLTDHYDPRSKTLRLSQAVFSSNSIAAIGVAAHEAGHAIQHATRYVPLGIRNSLVPVAQFGSSLSFPLLLIGILFAIPFLAQLGVYLFTGVVLFQLVTLPVEYNASNRAIALLERGAYLTRQEIGGAREVLNAAALTYVAAALTAALNLFRLLLITGMLGGRDEQ